MIWRAMRVSLLGLLYAAIATTATAQGLPPDVMDELKRARIPLDATAVYVAEVGSRAAWIAHNHKKPFNPASTMKLVTTYAGLEVLGPTYTWKTTAYATGSLRGDVLHGDLIIKGGGDPKFLADDLRRLLRQIRARGVRVIHGNVLLDRSAFEETNFDAAAFDGSPEKSYNAGPDALLLNYKTWSFRFMPDNANGKVGINLDPVQSGITVNPPQLGRGECNSWVEALGAEIDSEKISFAGSYDITCGEREWSAHAYRMTNDQYFSAVFRQLWRETGGTLYGKIRQGALVSDARIVAEWTSPTLSEIVRDINKYSNNVMARHLLLTLAADPLGQPASAEQGARVIKGWLASKRIEAAELVIENGSGLSRNERIAAGTMGKLLAAAWRSPRMPEFIASMPIAAYDGSMRNRMKETGVAGSAHIKTGGLREVRTIAGYVLAASGKRYAVVYFINHANASAGRSAQDALLKWIYDNG